MSIYGQNKAQRRLADSLRYVQEVPYVGNCGDPVYCKIVRQVKEMIICVFIGN
jgi:hypothetical protein